LLILSYGMLRNRSATEEAVGGFQSSRSLWVPGLTFVLALVILIVAVNVYGTSRPLDQDAPQYLALGQSLLAGNGFKDTSGPWADQISCGRMPAWPALVAISLAFAPAGASGAAVIRFADVVCLALVSGAFAILAWQMGVRSRFLCMLSGLAVALSPVMAFIALSGMSEVLFLLFAVLGLLAIRAGGKWCFAGALAIGLASLVRSNYILFPFLGAGIVVCWPAARDAVLKKFSKATVVALLVLSCLPPFLWVVRNYTVSGRFPLLSSIEGETLWGSNNPVTAGNLEYWGYWVIPDQISGETPKLELAKSLSEIQLSDYYHEKAVQWSKQNLGQIPRLVLGKLVRALVPLPWWPVAASYVVFAYRVALWLLAIVLVRFWWADAGRLYLVWLGANFGLVLATTILYYGTYRFTHCTVEIFFLPLISLGLEKWWRQTRLARA